jgi:hypothetical protein
MLRAHPVSLNAVSYNGVIRMLETIRDVKPEREAPVVHHVYVDTGPFPLPFSSLTAPAPSPLLVGDPDFYKSKLLSAMGNQFSMEGFTIEKKADATYKIVSAGLSSLLSVSSSLMFPCLYLLSVSPQRASSLKSLVIIFFRSGNGKVSVRLIIITALAIREMKPVSIGLSP